MTTRRRWTRDELLLALHLYCRLPFGKQHKGNPQVIELAKALDRTPDSVAMKLNNLTSLDEVELARGVKGLPGASALDREVWSEFQTDRERVIAEAEAAWAGRMENQPPEQAPRETEAVVRAKVRLGQDFFRRAVLENFESACALTGISHPALVNASHIVPWAEAPEHRVDPCNGLALNRLHDAAFDRHLVTFDEDLRLVVSRRLRDVLPKEEFSTAFLAYEGRPLRPWGRHQPSPALLDKHRQAFTNAGG